MHIEVWGKGWYAFGFVYHDIVYNGEFLYQILYGLEFVLSIH